jgi:hypothetical protein
LNTVLEAAKVLAHDSRFAFCFVGGGSEHGVIRKYAETHQLRHVHTLPYSSMEELAGSLSAADLHIVVMGDPFVGMIHPCKIYNVLLVGAPILYLGPIESHIRDIFDEIQDPTHLHEVRHGDVDSMLRAIQKASDAGTRGSIERFRQIVDRFGAASLLGKTLDLITASEVSSHTKPVTPQLNPVGTPEPTV